MMDNNWRPTQGGEPTMDTGDWRSQLQSDARQRIVNKIMETLKRHLPVSGQDGLQELRKIAVRFEEKIYMAATSQPDYLRKISLKMLTMETKSQNPMGNSLPPNGGGPSNKPPDAGQSLPIPMSANQPQQRQHPVPQNIPNNIASQNPSNIPSSLPPVSGLQNPIPNVVGQNGNMQNPSGASQNPLGNPMGQGVPSNVYSNSQRQMLGRQPVASQQQQQPTQNQQYLYQQQFLKQKFQQGNIPHSLIQSHLQQQQQQQQQNILQPSQLQSSQQSIMQTSSVMQPSVMQSTPLSSLQQTHQPSVQQPTQSVLQQSSQSVLGQQQQQLQQSAIAHQQPATMQQQSILPQQQQQQQLIGQQSNPANMQQNQLIGGQSNSVGDMRQQQQQSNLTNLQQQQQMIAQQNNLSNMHQQQLGSQNNVSGLQQQQQLLGTQSGNSSTQTNQHSVHMMQQNKVPVQQQQQQNGSSLLQPQGQQSQMQPPQQQMMSQMPSQPSQLQQQLGLQQQPNQLSRELHQRLQASGQAPGSLLQPPNMIDQQKQLYQSQRALPETSSTSLDSTAQTGHANGGDWQEEIYQKIKVMKEMYFPELSEMHQKVSTKLQQHDSTPQQPKSEQLEKLKMFKTMLERLMSLLQVQKNNIVASLKDKLPAYEKQIVGFLNQNRPRKSVSPLQQGQLPNSHLHSMQQSQSQVTQVQSHDNQMNSQLHPANMQGSMATMQQNNGTNMQHNSMSGLSGVSTAQQNVMNTLQPGSGLDGPGNSLGSIQQVPMGSMQQNSMSTPQQTNINSLSSQSGVNVMQPNLSSLQSGSSLLQHQHLKQQQDQQMLQPQQLKQQMQRQMHQQQLKQQMMQQQQSQQQQQQQQMQGKQQIPAQFQAHQMSQLHQMNDVNDMKMRQGMNAAKAGVFQQHLSAGQRSAYSQQQMKSGASFPISSPQLLQAASPQIPQLSSPQVDQPNVLSSLSKTGTPLQSASSPYIAPSPSIPMAPSPMPGDGEKPNSGALPHSNAGNIAHQQANSTAAPPPSFAIGTPGISASPLLEFSSPDSSHGNALTTVSGKSSITELPIERLIRVVKSMSPQALSASVSDIGSVVSMIDRIAGSAPGNGSRAAVGEDLVAMTKCRLQARNFITQDGTNGTRKMRRCTSAMPLNVVSSAGSINDTYKQLAGSESSDIESVETSRIKRPRIEVNHSLLEEIREINQRLIDTVVDISDEDVDPSAAATAIEGGEGTIVKCSFSAVALSPNLKLQYTSAQMSPILPLRLLVPTNYPNCSPVLLDKFPVEVSKEYEDLSVKAKSKFSISLRSLSQPMSLGEIARTWDICARAIISEHAQQSGGGSFSSKYGTWESCLSAV